MPSAGAVNRYYVVSSAFRCPFILVSNLYFFRFHVKSLPIHGVSLLHYIHIFYF